MVIKNPQTTVNSQTAANPQPAVKAEKEVVVKKPEIKKVPANPVRQKKKDDAVQSDKVKIIPLGGLGEVGKNITLIEYKDDIIIIDCGLAFPDDDDMPGVDLVIPDMTYIEKRKDKIKGVVITHGHEDHIGALPYLFKIMDSNVYASRMTLGLVENKMLEHKITNKIKLNAVIAGQKIKLGVFEVEFISTNHSVADAMALSIQTPMGIIVHTGDFKIDCTPVQGKMIDLAHFGQIGKKGVLALLSDSTNAERAGYTMSESKVGESIDGIFRRSNGKRIIVTTFASNVDRVQQIIGIAAKYNRKIAISGRSMINVVKIASSLGYMKIAPGQLIELSDVGKHPPGKVAVISTGSQGEPMSALYRMAFSDHKNIEIGSSDVIIISASPIPGNEKLVTRVINALMKAGAEVVYESLAEIHASGHACQEELKLMLGIVRPKYFIPVHGEYKHLKKHAALGQLMGVENKNIFMMENGKVLEIDKVSARISGSVTSGQLLVDGIGVGDVGSVVLRDRKLLSEDGLMIVVAALTKEGTLAAGPDIVSRGFVYVKENEEMMYEIKQLVKNTIIKCKTDNVREWSAIKGAIKDAVSDLLYAKTKRKPMVLPILEQVSH